MLAVQLSPWQRIISQALAASTANDTLRLRFTLYQGNVFAVFRVVCSAFTGGTVQARLRFGFTNADADVSSDTILFTALGALGGLTAQLPDTVTAGNGPLRIAPPRVSLFTTTAGFTGTYELHVAYVQVA